jgi:midasin
MRAHAKGLLKTLEGFYETTTLGQFEQRIKLLQQLSHHAAMRMQDAGHFKILHTALENFIAYFSRLAKPVRESLAKGRQTLERDVNNVIKLASWKDTNIEALKQSAKTSHRKLSKLVRKFRTVLNRPVSSVMVAGFADEGLLLQDVSMEVVSAAVNPEALEICSQDVAGWNDRPTRFKNLAVTTNMMRKLCTPSSEAVDGASYIEEFVTSLAASITELQKATPTTLTEENKQTVQQLKTQKRKVYADTMKELRQMGVVPNLSVDTLVKQDELSTILSTLPLVGAAGEECGRVAEGHLHKALHIMPQVRAVSKEHSGDLTSNDVARSIGYIEGLLHISIRQRNVLSRAAQTLEMQNAPLSIVANLNQPTPIGLSWASQEAVQTTTSLPPMLRWLVAVLRTATDVVAAQAKLGKTNESDALLRSMREWTTKLQSLVDDSDKLPTLPANIQSQAHQTFDESVKATITELHSTYSIWVEEYEIARTVLKHILPFLFSYPESQAAIPMDDLRVTVVDYATEIFGALDLILGAMQDVEAALKDIPVSTEDAVWLTNEEKALSAAINGLHAPQISNALQTILDKMHNLHTNESLQCIAALFASVQPILRQYLASHKYLVDRFDSLHASTSKLCYRLAKSFIQIGTSGFCTPQEKSNDQQKGNEKLEEGTGLGEGEGAEDISKDIEEDEDLEELAQQEKGEREGSIEEQEDAVDMGEQDMEGETEEVGEKEDKGDESGDEGDDDVQSEVGSVDDLGPSAVDEKMWDDGGKDEDAKDREGKEDVGTEDQEEQVAAEQKEKPKDDAGEDGEQDDKQEGKEGEEEDEEMEGEDQDENVGPGETEQMDPHAKEEETLDLPEDLNIDGQDDDGKEDDLGDMDMDDDLPEDTMDPETEAGAEPDTVDEEIGPEQEGEEEKETTGHVEDEEEQPEDGEDEGEDEGDEPM